MVFTNAFKYSYLGSKSESSEPDGDQPFISQNDDPEDTVTQLRKSRYRGHSFTLLTILPWLISFASTALLLYNFLRGPDEFACTRLLNPYSPAIEEGVVEYYETDFENEFAHKTKWRGPPTPELEAAWSQIWNLGGVEVPLDGPAQLGKAPEELVHIDSDETKGYSGMLEVFHQLHCLNLIRQYTWKDYYNDHLGGWLNEGHHHDFVDLNVTTHASVGDRMHVDHCIEALRLQLMCNADLTPMLVRKDDSVAIGMKADFNVHKKCRSWDRVVEWQRAHTTDKDAAGLKPSGSDAS
ncbi:hypothetical protein F4777DRAFT_470745 [Nemania sp. FL0916]|nr:hypothetical protein F4777DRAFT_470745 [Nemania sp. FL0916]